MVAWTISLSTRTICLRSTGSQRGARVVGRSARRSHRRDPVGRSIASDREQSSPARCSRSRETTARCNRATSRCPACLEALEEVLQRVRMATVTERTELLREPLTEHLPRLVRRRKLRKRLPWVGCSIATDRVTQEVEDLDGQRNRDVVVKLSIPQRPSDRCRPAQHRATPARANTRPAFEKKAESRMALLACGSNLKRHDLSHRSAGSSPTDPKMAAEASHADPGPHVPSAGQ